MDNIIQKQNIGYVELIAPEGYKIRLNGDNTQSYESVNVPNVAKQRIDDYILVTSDTPDEIVEEPEIDTGDEEITAEEALEIITGGLDNDTE